MLVDNSTAMREWERRFPAPPYMEMELQVYTYDLSPSGVDRVIHQLESRHHAITVRQDDNLMGILNVWFGPVMPAVHISWWPVICSVLDSAGVVSWTDTDTGLHTHLFTDSVFRPDTLRSLGYSMPLEPLLYVYGRVPGPRCRLDTLDGPNAFIVDGVSKSGHRTLEFRGGKGTLCVKRILSLIDFVLSLADYTNSAHSDSVSWGEWYRHVRDYRERFPELLRVIERYECERGIPFVS